MIEIGLSIIISVCFVLAAYAGQHKRCPSDMAFEDFEASNQMKYAVPIVIVEIFLFSYFIPQRSIDDNATIFNSAVSLIYSILLPVILNSVLQKNLYSSQQLSMLPTK